METQPTPERARTRLQPIFLLALRDAARRQQIPLQAYIVQLLEAAAADLRLRQITTPHAPKAEPAPPNDYRNHCRRSARAAETQRILFLAHSENLTVAQIAQRTRRSLTTVRAILKAYDSCPTHVAMSSGHNGSGVSQEFNLQLPGPRWRRNDGS
jgi:hypothetical protein